MDAKAYLMRHGWSGPGTPLNKNSRPGPHGGLGLTRPILVARKQNTFGVGKKVTKDSATNQWWLRGFEDALKGVGEEAPVAETKGNALTSELYRFFVRGEGLAGTIHDKPKQDKGKVVKSKSSKSKRKREDDDEDKENKKKEKAVRKEEKRKRRKVDGESGSASASSSGEESKEERRLRRKAKKEAKEKKSKDSDAGKKSKKSKCLTEEEDYPTPVSIGEEPEVELSEAKKDKKEKKDKKLSKKSKSEDSKTSDSKEKEKKDKKKEKKEKKEKSKST